MADQFVRGYTIRQVFAYIEQRFPGAPGEKAIAQLSPELLALRETAKEAEWYPRAHFASLLRAVASVKHDEKGSYDDLVACGEFIASEAANTFLKLVLKILTPALFAKKIPSLWDRDHKGGGKFEVTSVDARQIDLSLVDVEGFDHIGVVSVGWINFGLKSMGKEGVAVKCDGWSLAKPGPAKLHYTITWT